MENKRSPGLIAIVIYKGFVALLLTATTIALLFALKNHQSLIVISESYLLEGKLQIIEWLLEKVVNAKQQTLQFSSIALGVYGAVTAVEAIGLWYKQAWATILVLVLVGISIPPEIFELTKSITLLKLTVFLINVTVFGYLIRHFPKHRS